MLYDKVYFMNKTNQKNCNTVYGVINKLMRAAVLAAAVSALIPGISTFAATSSKTIYQDKTGNDQKKAEGQVVSEATVPISEQITDSNDGKASRDKVVVSKSTLNDTSITLAGKSIIAVSDSEKTAGGENSMTTAENKVSSASDNASDSKIKVSETSANKAGGPLDTEADNNQAAPDSEAKNAEYLENQAGSLISSGRFSLMQKECYDNLDEAPVLAGGEVRFLANKGSAAQQLSAVFKSSDGKVIVVDGGQKADTEHLISVIKEFGGRVDAWLITHPQTDHVGALNYILESGRKDISIEGIYYNFVEQSWYDENDPDECGMVRVLRKNMEVVPASRLHSDMKAGSNTVLSEKLSFKALNEPQLSKGIFAGNSAGIMYDISIDGKHFIILGDMAAEVGDKLMEAGAFDGIVCDYVQISHHGQTGVSDDFYKKLNPRNCIWPTNEYIYYAEGVTKSGLGTTLTKMCISKLKVKRNFVTLGRDVVIK